MLTFENGARVVLNPTSIVDNDIYLSATSPGGLSLVDDADVPDALNAVGVVTSSGIGELDAVELDTALSGVAIELYPSIGQTSEDFVGISTTDDLEVLLQLVNLYMSAPRFDEVALESTIRSLQSYVDDPNSDPDLAEYIAYSEARFGSEPRFRVIPTAEELATLDLEAIERVWRDRFTNAGDWVFVLSGDFDMDAATDLARRYFGTLEGAGSTEGFKDFQRDPPATDHQQGSARRHRRQGFVDARLDHSDPGRDTDTVHADVLTSVLEHPPHRSHPRGAGRLLLPIGVRRDRHRTGSSWSRPTSTSPAIQPPCRTSPRSSSTTSPRCRRRARRTTSSTTRSPSSRTHTRTSTTRRSAISSPRQPSDPELITRFKNRIDVLNDITPSDVADLHLRGHAARSIHRGPDRSRLNR